VSFQGLEYILEFKFISHTTFFELCSVNIMPKHMQLEVDIQLELELEKSVQVGICLYKQ
jgi:hypothetical protein